MPMCSTECAQCSGGHMLQVGNRFDPDARGGHFAWQIDTWLAVLVCFVPCLNPVVLQRRSISDHVASGITRRSDVDFSLSFLKLLCVQRLVFRNFYIVPCVLHILYVSGRATALSTSRKTLQKLGLSWRCGSYSCLRCSDFLRSVYTRIQPVSGSVWSDSCQNAETVRQEDDYHNIYESSVLSEAFVFAHGLSHVLLLGNRSLRTGGSDVPPSSLLSSIFGGFAKPSRILVSSLVPFLSKRFVQYCLSRHA